MDAFDKHIRSIFDKHEVPVDTDALWKKVEPSLVKRKMPGRLLLILFLLFGFLGIIYILKDPIDQNNFALSSNTDPGQSFFGRKGQLITNISNPDSQRTETKQFESGIVNSLPQKSTINRYTETNNESKSAVEIINEIVKDNDVKAGSNVNTYSSESFENRRRIMFSTKKVATNTEIQPVISLSANQKTVFDFTLAKIKSSGFKYSFDVFAGMDYAHKYLTANSFDYKWYENKRKETESYLEAFNVGVQFNIAHKSGVIAGTGLVYHQINEQFQSNNTMNIETFTDGIIEIVTNADGSSTEVSGKKMVIEQKSWDKLKYNNYGFLNIPFYAGYAFHSGLLRVELTAGIDVNLAFQKSAEIIGSEGFPVSISSAQNSIFRDHTSVNLNGGIKLLYPISEHFAVYAAPNFHYNLKSITRENYPLEQKYIHSGIRIGARYNF